MYCQLDEEQFILEYFDGKGRFLDVGANDGVSFSNTRILTDLEWSGVCVEPDPFAFSELVKNYNGNDSVELVNAGIGDKDELRRFTLFDDSLLSTFDEKHRQIWKESKVKHDAYINLITWDTLFNTVGSDFDFINIDAEGMSKMLLSIFPFDRAKNVRMFIVEHDDDAVGIGEIFNRHNYREIHINGLNVIYAK